MLILNQTTATVWSKQRIPLRTHIQVALLTTKTGLSQWNYPWSKTFSLRKTYLINTTNNTKNQHKIVEIITVLINFKYSISNGMLQIKMVCLWLLLLRSCVELKRCIISAPNLVKKTLNFLKGVTLWKKLTSIGSFITLNKNLSLITVLLESMLPAVQDWGKTTRECKELI